MPAPFLARIPPAHIILDSTLRDGEQAPGVNLSPEEKALYVQTAEDVGLRYIEIGFPQNPFDYDACKAAAAVSRHARLVAMAVTTEESIAKVCEIGAHEVLLIVPSSGSHLRAVYGAPIEKLISQLSRSITFATERGLLVNVGLEDASHRDMLVISRVIEEAKRHPDNVDCITIADTRGQLLPTEAERLIRDIRNMLGSFHCRLAFHAHDDLGLATANTLAALTLEQAVDCVHATVCGFGERAGNASLEQVAVILELKLKRATNLNLTKLRDLALFVQKAFLTPIHPHAPVLGSKVFLHESGIHQKGMFNESSSFQFLDPVIFGTKAEFILGKHSGKRLRSDIASAAHCSEEEVLELQRSFVEHVHEDIQTRFLDCVRFLEVAAFRGVHKGRAVKILIDGKKHST